MGELLEKSFYAADRYMPSKLLADAGYDAEWVHQACREKWKVESWIKPVVHQALNQAGYGKRWHIESFIGGIKRLCGSALTARLDINPAPRNPASTPCRHPLPVEASNPSEWFQHKVELQTDRLRIDLLPTIIVERHILDERLKNPIGHRR